MSFGDDSAISPTAIGVLAAVAFGIPLVLVLFVFVLSSFGDALPRSARPWSSLDDVAIEVCPHDADPFGSEKRSLARLLLQHRQRGCSGVPRITLTPPSPAKKRRRARWTTSSSV